MAVVSLGGPLCFGRFTPFFWGRGEFRLVAGEKNGSTLPC